MSVRVMSWVFDQSRSKGAARLVLLAIADCANDEGAHAYPSETTLQRKTGLSERGVRDQISKLEKLGELEAIRNGGPRGCNLYRIIMTPADPAGSGPRQDLPPGKSCPPTPANPAPLPRQILPPEPSVEPSVEPSFKNTVKIDLFERFWAAYPRRVARGEAERAFAKAIKIADPEVIIAGAAAYRDDGPRQRSEIQYTKHPATWLNGKCWLDESPPPGTAIALGNGQRIATSDRKYAENMALVAQLRALEAGS